MRWQGTKISSIANERVRDCPTPSGLHSSTLPALHRKLGVQVPLRPYIVYRLSEYPAIASIHHSDTTYLGIPRAQQTSYFMSPMAYRIGPARPRSSLGAWYADPRSCKADAVITTAWQGYNAKLLDSFSNVALEAGISGAGLEDGAEAQRKRLHA